MENTQPRRLPLFVIGGLLFLAGPIAYYFIQVQPARLSFTPWYMPILATLGLVCMIASVVQRGGVLRIIGLGVFTLVCAFEWFALGIMMRTPEYQGPAAVGSPIPAFAAMRADGTAFTQSDLETGKPAIMLFFRGRW